ncbi:MAG: relaxase/mobilization nuclease domain-containing protein [Draconibacterium sp.]
MVIKIHQVAHTENALRYNEKKVREGVATFFDSRNTVSVNPFMYDEKHRLKILADIEKVNPRIKNKCLHISFNPSATDILKLDDKTIRADIEKLMEHLGYGNQPYFVYKHKDIERVHFHIVSTRIDRETGRKIKDNFEREKVKRFIQQLEQRHELIQTPNKEQNFTFNARSRNIKQNLENLFKHLNKIPEITSKEMCAEALKLFNVEIRKSGRGHIVVVTDDIGNPIRYPIRLSNFKEGPKFYKSLQAENESQINKQVLDKFQIAQWVRDLNRLVEKSKTFEKTDKPKLRRKSKNRKL